jgi:hypothetical protein
LAAETLKNSPQDEDAQLANVLRLGLVSDYNALIDKQNMAALGQIKSATAAAQKLLQDHPDCYDANLAAGIQNYLLSSKPSARGVAATNQGSADEQGKRPGKFPNRGRKGTLFATIRKAATGSCRNSRSPQR